MAPTRRMIAASLGKMPTTSVRRLTSPLRRSSGLVEWILARCSLGKESCRRGRLPRPGRAARRVWVAWAGLGRRHAPLGLGGAGVVLGEGGGDERRHHAPAAPAGMGERVAHEVHPAALPGGPEHARDRGLDAVVRVRDHQLDTGQATPGPGRRVSGSSRRTGSPKWGTSASAGGQCQSVDPAGPVGTVAIRSIQMPKCRDS